MDVLQRIGQPAKQCETDHRLNEELAKGHDQTRHRQRRECDRVGPMGRALERRETLDLAAGLRTVQLQRALAPVKQCNGAQHDQQQRAAVGNQDVVAHLAPGLTGVGQARARVLHKLLDQVAGLGRLRQRQTAVARHPLTHLAPHGRVVARLHLAALGIGLVFVGLVAVGIGCDLKDVGALDASSGIGRRCVLRCCAQRQPAQCQSEDQAKHDRLLLALTWARAGGRSCRNWHGP